MTLESAEWYGVTLQDLAMRLVARVSSCVFLGPEVCRDEAWLGVIRAYPTSAFGGFFELAAWPQSLHWLAYRFLPSCRRAAALTQEARAILQPLFQKRETEEKGGDGALGKDSVAWLRQVAKGESYDPVVAQLWLALAAVHTSADLVGEIVVQLAQHPDVLQAVRQEIEDVLANEDWSISTLSKMPLLDSILKESQRFKPNSWGTSQNCYPQDSRTSFCHQSHLRP